MPTISKKTGTIITAVLAVLFGCAGLLTCAGGVSSAPFIPGGYQVGQWIWLVANLCTGLAFIALPVVFYMLLVANRPDDAPVAPSPENTPK